MAPKQSKLQIVIPAKKSQVSRQIILFLTIKDYFPWSKWKSLQRMESSYNIRGALFLLFLLSYRSWEVLHFKFERSFKNYLVIN